MARRDAMDTLGVVGEENSLTGDGDVWGEKVFMSKFKKKGETIRNFMYYLICLKVTVLNNLCLSSGA